MGPLPAGGSDSGRKQQPVSASHVIACSSNEQRTVCKGGRNYNAAMAPQAPAHESKGVARMPFFCVHSLMLLVPFSQLRTISGAFSCR